MNGATFVHKDCGGDLLVDLSDNFVLIAPAISLSTRSATISVTELDTKGNKKLKISFFCRKCKEEVRKNDSRVLARCSVCPNQNPITQMYTTDVLPAICEKCVESLEGKDASGITPSTKKWLNLRPGFAKVLISNVLDKFEISFV